MTRCTGVNTTCDPEHENHSVKDGWIESKQEKKGRKTELLHFYKGHLQTGTDTVQYSVCTERCTTTTD